MLSNVPKTNGTICVAAQIEAYIKVLTLFQTMLNIFSVQTGNVALQYSLVHFICQISKCTPLM